MAYLKLLSFNARGLRDYKGRRKLFAYFHTHKYDLMLLQETHSCQQTTFIGVASGAVIYLSHGDNNSRGVAILIKPTLSYSLSKDLIDPNGRFIIIDIYLNNDSFTIINVYGPNIDDPSFFKDLSQRLLDFQCSSIIWAGDFNFVFNLQLDKQGGLQRTNFNARSEVLSLMGYYDLVDIWRERNPKSNLFTWHSSKDSDIHCRLDFFLCSRHLIPAVDSADAFSIFKSDHSCITMSLKSTLGVRGRGYWKLNASLLEDDNYVDEIRYVLVQIINDNFHLNVSDLWETIKFQIKLKSIHYSQIRANECKHYETCLLREISYLEKLPYSEPSDQVNSSLDTARASLDCLYDYD